MRQKGFRHTEETKQKMRQSKLAQNNPMWKDDKVGYYALHDWVKYRFPKPALCQNCAKAPALDCASISGVYKRNLDDWHWICRKCHMKEDGRLNNLQHAPKTGWDRKCNFCGKEYWTTPWDWNNGTGRYCSKTCSNKGRRFMPKVWETDARCSQRPYWQSAALEMPGM